MNTIVVGIVSWLVGIVMGFILGRLKFFQHQKNSDIVLLAVTVVWVISMIVELINPAYKTSPLVHGLMGMIAGFFYKPGQKPL